MLRLAEGQPRDLPFNAPALYELLLLDHYISFAGRQGPRGMRVSGRGFESTLQMHIYIYMADYSWRTSTRACTPATATADGCDWYSTPQRSPLSKLQSYPTPASSGSFTETWAQFTTFFSLGLRANQARVSHESQQLHYIILKASVGHTLPD